MNTTTSRDHTETTANATTGRGRTPKLILLSVLFAFVLALMSQTGAGAAPLTTSTDGWNPANFESSCRAAGGRPVEIDSPGLHYSRCYFPDGSSNTCNWTKKTCTFGLVAGTGTKAPAGQTGTVVLDDSRGSGSGNGTGTGTTTGTKGTKIAKSSQGTILIERDEQP